MKEYIFIVTDQNGKLVHRSCAGQKILCIKAFMRQEYPAQVWPSEQNDKAKLAKELWEYYFKAGYRVKRFELIPAPSQKKGVEL